MSNNETKITRRYRKKSPVKSISAQIRTLKEIQDPAKLYERAVTLANSEQLSRQNLVLLSENIKASRLSNKDKLKLLELTTKLYEAMWNTNTPYLINQINQLNMPQDVAGDLFDEFRKKRHERLRAEGREDEIPIDAEVENGTED